MDISTEVLHMFITNKLTTEINPSVQNITIQKAEYTISNGCKMIPHNVGQAELLNSNGSQPASSLLERVMWRYQGVPRL